MSYNVVWSGKLKLTFPTTMRHITVIYPEDRSSMFLLPACILSKTVTSVSRSFITSSLCVEIHICAHNRNKAWEANSTSPFLPPHPFCKYFRFFSFIRQIMSKTLCISVTVTVFRILQTWRQIQYFCAEMYTV
jgi:hypothetical protein